VNAIPNIHAATIVNAGPASSRSQSQEGGESIFREAMHQALQPEKQPVRSSEKSPAREAAHAPASTRSSSSSSRTTQQVASHSTRSQTSAESSESPAAGTPVSNGSSNPAGPAAVPDASGNSNTQTETANSTTAASVAGEPGGISPANPVPSITRAAELPTDIDTKNSGRNGQKAADQSQSVAEPATIATTAPLPPTAIGGAAPNVRGAQPSGSGSTSAQSLLDHLSTADAGVTGKQNQTLAGSGLKPLANAGDDEPAPGSVHTGVQVPADSTNPAPQNAGPAATAINSSDLFLQPIDAGSCSQSSDQDADIDSLSSSLASSGSAVATSNEIVASTITKSDPSGNSLDSYGADAAAVTSTLHVAAPAHVTGSDPRLTGAPAGIQTTGSNGNPSASHSGTSAAMPIGRSADRNLPISLTPSGAFSAMDQAGSNLSGSLLHATSNQLTVGVKDPGLGWIEVRAERVGGQISAALTANSATTHAELTSALPAISSYLNDHHQPVQQIYVETGQASQNPPGSQGQASNGRQNSDDTSPQPVVGISGVGEVSRLTARQPTTRTDSLVEAASQGSKVDGYQFSVRA
jgi:hypothetical protein